METQPIHDATEAIRKQIIPDKEEVCIVEEEQVLKLYLKRKDTCDHLVRDGIQLWCAFWPEISNIKFMMHSILFVGYAISLIIIQDQLSIATNPEPSQKTTHYPISIFQSSSGKSFGLSLQSMNATMHINIKSMLKPELSRNHLKHLTLKV